MPAVAGWECINRFYGPAVNCSCQRFFLGQRCDAARFYQFGSSLPQLHPQWLFLNGQEWLQPLLVIQPGCVFAWNSGSEFGVNNFVMAWNDNIFYNPPIDPFPFVTLTYARSISLTTISEWGQAKKWGHPSLPPRNQVVAADESLWQPSPGNTVDAVKPLGDWTMTPALCFSEWTPNQDPA